MRHAFVVAVFCFWLPVIEILLLPVFTVAILKITVENDVGEHVISFTVHSEGHKAHLKLERSFDLLQY